MSELTRRSQALIDVPLVPSPPLEYLQSRSRQRHHRRRAITVGLLGLCVIAAFSIAKIGNSTPSLSAKSKTSNTDVQLVSYYKAAVTVSNSTLAAVGLPANVEIPTKVVPSLSTVGTNGVVSYVGAEYCPFCAIQRWALLVALSKFGTFTSLDKQVFSSSSDVYPRLASWSFVGAKYSSPFFTFQPTELSSSTPNNAGGYRSLEKMSSAQRRAFNKYNRQGGLSFVDIGNHYVTLGASASPAVLEGLTLGNIGNELGDPKSPVAQAIDGTANYLIAAMCTMAQKTAPSICSSPTTREAAKALGLGVSPTSEISGGKSAPTQPPTNSPLSVWKKWSGAEHKYLLVAAANFRNPNPACTILKISVNGTRLTRPVLGIPKGVTDWAISIMGKCGPK
jgi:hypothetical protein